MRNLIKRILRESVLNEAFQDIEYHTTTIRSLIDIMRDNKIKLSSWLFGRESDRFGKKFFYLSLSRTGYPKLGYGMDRSYFGRILFDGRKLGYNFKSLPVDYWKDSGPKPSREDYGFEYEDRLITDKPELKNVSKYIIRIEVVIYEDAVMERVIELKRLCDYRGIEMRVYNTREDMMRDKNRVDLGDIGPSEDKVKVSRDKYNEDRTIIYILALLMYDSKYFNDYDLFESDLMEYLKKNNLNIGDITVNSIFDRSRKMSVNYEFQDSLKMYVRSAIREENNENAIKFVNLLIREIRKSGAGDLNKFIDFKIYGSDGGYIDYSNNLSFFVWDDQVNEWVELDNNRAFNDKSVKELTYKKPRRDDITKFERSKIYDKTLGGWINYLLNKYDYEYVKNFIRDDQYKLDDK